MSVEKISGAGTIRRWRYSEPHRLGSTLVEVESSSSEDGYVLLKVGSSAAWIVKDELEEFIGALREAGKVRCCSCDGEGWA